MTIPRCKGVAVWASCMAILLSTGLGGSAHAQSADDFSLQVSPSPLVASLKPGKTTNLELKIRNAGTQSETLKIEPRQFSVNNQTGEVKLDDQAPSEIAPWVSFGAQTFSIKPGEWYTQTVRVALPKDTGFSYSLALVISRTKNVTSTESGRLIRGSVAVFTLLNVDRPGAVRKLEISDLSMGADIYEYLPATINMSFKNTGNTIVQPYGNVFIQRGSDDSTPLATLPVNDRRGYILPGSDRMLSADWTNGFPLYKVTKTAEGATQTQEQWDWQHVSNFRIGQYTAKLVAVYNDGQRDVPLVRETTFWVMPWKIILAAVIILAILLFGVWTILRKIFRLFKPRKKQAAEQS